MKLKFDEYWANVNNLNVLVFISLILDPRHKLRYVEWIIRRSYDPTNAFVLCQRIKDVLKKLFDFYASTHPSSTQKASCTGNPNSSGQTQGDWIRASHDPIIIEENLLSLENMEEEMQDLTSEQPTIVIDETNEVLDTTHELS
ncbi:hypothetical protein V6N12_003029 [Hibiscus sabdariffa]|uniref:hAT-like transposase RNase-H fold domain-containing protein n=1 Tax=Hibiscus sabdariffa TaxID=183260 RepID=A0ABR2EB49_9ROSI